MKIGEKLARMYYGNAIAIEEIIGETKTQWKLSDGTRLNKNTGDIVGGGQWSTLFYRKATDADVSEITKRRMIRKLKKTDFSTLDFDTLAKIDKLLDVKE